jgi:acetyltransferase-like isoleucine patch superfamily enzyme
VRVRLAASAFSILLPWPLRRRFLNRFFGHKIDPGARIGLSWIFPGSVLTMGPGARIGHLNVIRSVEEVRLGEQAAIGTMNWITDNLAGYRGPVSVNCGCQRRSRLTLDRFAAITSRHYFDCSEEITIGEHTVAGGIRSVWQTHYLDLDALEQTCQPITVGASCFISTNCLLLGGAVLPDKTVLGAGSVLISEQSDSFSLYAGSPATKKKAFGSDFPFFNRTVEPIAKPRHPGR